jgi:Cytosol aminopeptidase family, N-terminal domain
MKKLFLVLFVALLSLASPQLNHQAQAQSANTLSKPTEMQVPGAPIPTRILVQSPSDTTTELQIICLFESTPDNTLRGSLAKINEKLNGLLDQIRQPTLFRGELGETILVDPPAGTIAAKKLLLIGLGDSQTFTPRRLQIVGTIAYRESNRLGIAHPYFAPTILDGDVTKFATGEVSENFMRGFLRASRTHKLLVEAGAAQPPVVHDLTFLAGPSHAADTRQGIAKAFPQPPRM